MSEEFNAETMQESNDFETAAREQENTSVPGVDFDDAEIAAIRSEAVQEGAELRHSLDEVDHRLELEFATLGKRAFEASQTDEVLADKLGVALAAVTAQTERKSKIVKQMEALEAKVEGRIADLQRAREAEAESRRYEEELAQKEAAAREAMERAQALVAEAQQAREAHEASRRQADAAALAASQTMLLSTMPGKEAVLDNEALLEDALPCDASAPVDDALLGVSDAEEEIAFEAESVDVEEDVSVAVPDEDESAIFDVGIVTGTAPLEDEYASAYESDVDEDVEESADADIPQPSFVDPNATMLLTEDAVEPVSPMGDLAADPNSTMLLSDDEDIAQGDYAPEPIAEEPKAGLTCSTCGSALNEGDLFCMTCGTPVAAAQPTAPVPAVSEPVEPATPAPSVCSKCGNAIQPGDRFCMMCGTPVQAVEAQPAPAQFQAMLCPNCGAEYVATDRFCMMCGHAL